MSPMQLNIIISLRFVVLGVVPMWYMSVSVSPMQLNIIISLRFVVLGVVPMWYMSVSGAGP